MGEPLTPAGSSLASIHNMLTNDPKVALLAHEAVLRVTGMALYTPEEVKALKAKAAALASYAKQANDAHPRPRHSAVRRVVEAD